MKIINKHIKPIHVLDMQDGQIGQFTESMGVNANKIVQRVGKILVTLGEGDGGVFSSILTVSRETNCYLHILEEGTTLEI